MSATLELIKVAVKQNSPIKTWENTVSKKGKKIVEVEDNKFHQ